MYQGSLAILSTSKNAKLSTDKLQSMSLSRSATLSRTRWRDRCPDRCAMRCPGKSVSRFLYPRQSIDQRLAVLLLLSRCVLKYQRRLVTTINVYILVICSILKFYNKLT